MNELTNPVNASDVVVLDLKNLSGSVQFRTTVSGELQWKASNGSTWFKICSLEILRGRSITDVTVNAQNKFVLTFSDLTTQIITISALEDAVLRATNAATQALASAGAASAVAMGTATIRPKNSSLVGNFAMSKTFPRWLAFSRTTVGTYIDQYGIIRTAKANVPRFTHDPVTAESMGYLNEEDRTNNITNYTQVNVSAKLTKVSTTEVAPDGTATATIIEKNSADNSTFYPPMAAISTLPNGFYVRSMFVKPLVSDECKIIFEGIGGNAGAGGALWFDVLTKTFSGDTISPVEFGYEEHPTLGYIRVWVAVEKADNRIIANNFYLGGYGNTSASTNRCSVWGFQFEEGKKLSSIIPTSGSIGYRTKDIPYIKSEYLAKSFSIGLVGLKSNGYEKTQGGTSTLISSDYSVTNGLAMNGALMSSFSIWDGTTSQFSPTFASKVNTLYNASFSWNSQSNNCKAVVENSTIVSSQITNVFTGKNIYLLSRRANSNYFNGTLKSIVVYQNVISDAEMQEVATNVRLFGMNPRSAPTNSDLGSSAFLDIPSLLSLRSRQEFSIDCTGSSITRNIRRPYAFTFEIVDSSGVTVTAQPASSCVENTDNNLVINGAVGKTLTYAITPIFEY